MNAFAQLLPVCDLWVPGATGLFRMSDSDYRAADAPHFSVLKHILRSPAHYRQAISEPPAQTASMLMGSLLHGLVLEGAAAYVVRPEGMDFRTKAGKEWRENQEVPVITTADGANIDGMCGTLKAHPAADSILRSLPKREVAVFAELCGLYCKCQLDALGHDDNGNLTIADLKMRQDARPDVFARDMANEHLDFQAAFYSDLLGRALGLEAAPFWLWIAVEENAPWAVAVYSPEETVMESGRRKYERALALLTLCRKTGRWPAYPESVQNINLPRWAIGNSKAEV